MLAGRRMVVIARHSGLPAGKYMVGLFTLAVLGMFQQSCGTSGIP